MLLAADISSFNVIDLILLGILGFGAYKGYNSGLNKPVEMASLAVSALVALRFYYICDQFYLERINLAPNYIPIISFITVFVVTFVVLQSVIKNVLSGLLGSNLGKAFGAVWGAIKFGLVISVVSLILGRANVPPVSMTQNAVVYPWIKNYGIAFLRETFANVPIATRFLQTLEDGGKPNTIVENPSDNVAPPQTQKPQVVR